MPRIAGSSQELENRRHRALALLDVGRSLGEVAHLIGCAASSVMRWRNTRRRGGARALKVRLSSGRPPKLAVGHRREILQLLLRGAMAHGYATELWTTARIADVIKREFGVRYHRDHVGRLMHRFGWSHQKPERRAIERDEHAIQRWKREDWPRVKKTLGGWAPTSFSATNRGSS